MLLITPVFNNSLCLPQEVAIWWAENNLKILPEGKNCDGTFDTSKLIHTLFQALLFNRAVFEAAEHPKKADIHRLQRLDVQRTRWSILKSSRGWTLTGCWWNKTPSVVITTRHQVSYRLASRSNLPFSR